MYLKLSNDIQKTFFERKKEYSYSPHTVVIILYYMLHMCFSYKGHTQIGFLKCVKIHQFKEYNSFTDQ